MSPIRIQRSRVKGSKLPPNTVVVTRGTRWGNPFAVGSLGKGYGPQQAVNDYMKWVTRGVRTQTCGKPPTCEEIIEELAGKNLACWCALDQPCHADFLLGAANGLAVPEPKQ